MEPRVVFIRMNYLSDNISCPITDDINTVQELISRFHQVAFGTIHESHLENSHLLHMKKTVQSKALQEYIVHTLDEIENNQVLVYRPCEEFRKLLEEGCITPVLGPSRYQNTLQTGISRPMNVLTPTASPCLKRKERTTSLKTMHLGGLNFSDFESTLLTPSEKNQIKELLEAGDEHIWHALEHFKNTQNIRDLRRVLYGPNSRSRLAGVDVLSSTFATLNVETPLTNSNDNEPTAWNALTHRGMDPIFKSKVVARTRPSLSLEPISSDLATLEFDLSRTNRFLHPIQERTASQESPLDGQQSINTQSAPRFRFDLSIDAHLGENSVQRYQPHMTIANMLDDIPVEENFTAHYRMGNVLGSGKYSIVKECFHLQSQKSYAVKIIDKFQISEMRFIKRELEIMHLVHHKGIVQLIELFETAEHLYIVMERCQQELFEYLDQQGQLVEETTRNLVQNLLSAVSYLHDNAIVHRDIKPENILILGDNVTEIKLSDFGIARKLDATNGKLSLTPYDSLTEVASIGRPSSNSVQVVQTRLGRAHTKCGTRDYVAPEVMSGKGYGTEADMWSVGIVTYVLLSGCAPVFLPSSAGSSLRFTEDIWSKITPQAKDFIEKATIRNPEDRMTATDALQHCWLR
uniref:Protein kinase putative n=1 Tax=Albugo laibachii Nc14 TaxID=890382 RepID=F0WIT0_9STRA|nr:protein kinase putative [Albugo laibachii Nc14]|eukprot:CCA21174.1 protein kinase putative [Albugo laibachii Nc14]